MGIIRSCLLVGILMTGSLTAAAQSEEEPTVSLIRGPYLQSGSAHSMTIRWRTNTATRSRVQYGETKENTDHTVNDSTLTTEHIVRLEGLQPHTRYYYKIADFTTMLQGDSANYFYTLPEQGKEGMYRIGVFGDCGNNSVNQRNVKQSVLKYLDGNYMDAWILLGDNAYNSGTDAEFQAKFFNVYKDDLLKQYPMFPAPGNHDYNDRDFPGAVAQAQRTHQTAYYQNFSMPTQGESGGVPSHTQAFYSFDIGNIHFLSLDSYGKEDQQYRLYDTTGPQVQWVKRDLEANKNKQWVIAYWHHPPYTMGSHNSDNEMELVHIRENFIRILERYGVDMVLCGHSHDYERTRLMKGHYGMEATYSAAQHNLSQSSGLYDGSENSCPYVKDSSNQGTVYVLSGSAGKLGGTQPGYPHDAMQYANATDGGATMLEVQGNRLDLKWICADGVIRDHFTVMKEVNKHTVLHVKAKSKITLTASFTGNYKWSEKGQQTKSITVVARSGKKEYTVQDNESCLKDTFTIITTK
ncbi:purple acid phosphatase family protein [Chitinophaga ginsengisoli]|uniref:3',5'-cyclic AMP phosphodiesterase CpdA n=1 Tax=Chitinophaga ginsengisoli TaxID=363837 RepID=A0A2P8FN21_9BACT|nr:metallophosphoesterase family protein [Chitinophaga ginsengisoli]PSL23120.1 3',5'-cyclic AMP phosphodiesterase CpdA [Chitinophaga ginsengisoli]